MSPQLSAIALLRSLFESPSGSTLGGGWLTGLDGGHTAAEATLVGEHVAARLRAAFAGLEGALSNPAAVVFDGHVMLAEDAVAARLLATTGSEGKRLAAIVRDRAAERYRTDGLGGSPSPLIYEPGDPPTCRLRLLLAEAILLDLVRPYAKCKGNDVPALAGAVLDGVGPAFWDRHATLAADGRALLDAHGVVIAPITDPIGIAVLKATRSVDAHRMLRFLVGQGLRQKREGRPDFRRIEIVGGFEAQARRLGLTSRSSAAQLRQVAIGMQTIRFKCSGWDNGGLLTWRELPEAGGRPAVLVLILGDPLLPDFVNTLPKTGLVGHRLDRHLVPLPTTLPPLYGRPNEWAAQCVFQVLVLQEMRKAARRYVRDGALSLSPGVLRDLADLARLKERLVPGVLRTWADGDTDAPPFLLGLGDDYYDLAPDYADARRMLIAAGRQSENASTARERGKDKQAGRPRRGGGRR